MGNQNNTPQAAGGTCKTAANVVSEIAQRPRLGATAGEVPEWIRLPRPGEHEPRTGLTRSVISRLCAEGKVKSITLRERGKLRGCRLVSLESLILFLRGLDTEQNAQLANGEGAK
jgi:hypothetical protein